MAYITMTEQTINQDVVLSERAANRINEIVLEQSDVNMLRLSVEGGGCSGFQYNFELVKESASNDILIEKNGATVLIDPMSMIYLQGSEIDFSDDLIGASFQVKNPNATAACGCGTSFSI